MPPKEPWRVAVEREYYLWAKREMERDLAAGMPLLFSLRSVDVDLVREWVTSLPECYQAGAWLALLKRFHETGCVAAGEPRSSDEIACVAEYLAWLGHPMRLWSAMERRAGGMRRSRVRATVLGCLRQAGAIGGEGALGVAVKGLGTVYERETLGARVTTDLDFGCRADELVFHHDIAMADRSVLRFMSLMKWRGISGQLGLAIGDERQARDAASLVWRSAEMLQELVPRIVAARVE